MVRLRGIAERLEAMVQEERDRQLQRVGRFDLRNDKVKQIMSFYNDLL